MREAGNVFACVMCNSSLCTVINNVILVARALESTLL